MAESNIEAVAVFFGSVYGTTGMGDWQTDPLLLGQACSLLNFLRDITESNYVARLSEYTPKGQPTIATGGLAAAAFIPFEAGKIYGSFLDTALDDSDIQTMLQNAIEKGLVPGATSNRAYFVFLPPYIAVKHRGELSPAQFLGYHDNFQLKGSGLPYAVMTHPGDSAILEDMTVFDQLTFETSHELVEMITDPTAQPGLGWYTGSGLEVSDICLKRQDAQGRITKWGVFHSYTVATYWSETNQLCSVPLEDGRALPSPSDSIIRGHQGPCDLGVIEHSVCSFSADTSELPGGPYTYSWTVIGADSGSHPLNFSTLNIQTPASQIPFMLRVLVTDRNGCQVATEQSFTPRSSQEAAISTLLCEIRHLLLVNFRFNPLWDPLRDLSTTSITSADIIEDKRRQSPTGGDECASVCTTRVAGQREVRQAEP